MDEDFFRNEQNKCFCCCCYLLEWYFQSRKQR